MLLGKPRWLIALGLLITALSIHPVAPAAADATEILYETSFEDTTDTTWLATPSSYDTSQKYTGDRSLKFTRSDPAEYIILRKDIDFVPGFFYEASAMVLTKDLSTTKNPEGARVAIQAWNKDGGYIGGAFGPGSVSPIWTSLSSGRYFVPTTAARLEVLIYIYTKTTGTAWFDDLTVTQVTPKLLRSKLNAPSYRGLLIPGDHDRIDVSTKLTPLGRPATDYATRIRLLTAGNRVFSEQTLPGAASSNWTMPATRLPAGSYTIQLDVLDTKAGNAVADTEKWAIRKLSRTEALPLSYVDKYGRLIRDGKPFFPLGFYSSRGDQATVDQLAGRPFNTLLPYNQPKAADLDYAEQQGINFLYTIKDYFYGTKYCPTNITSVADEVPAITATVNQYKNHPALLGWYVNDELPWYSYEERLTSHQNAIIAADPNHPTYAVDARTFDGSVYMRATDVYGPDIYAVHGQPTDVLSLPGSNTKAAQAQLPNRSLWPVVQNFAWSKFDGHFDYERPPTLAELRSMSWQYLAAGGKGLLFYSLQDMAYDYYPDIDDFTQLMNNATTVASEVSSLVPVIMSVAKSPTLTHTGGAWLDSMIRKYRGKVYVVGVNNTQTPGNSVTFTVPGARSVKVLNENRTLPVTPTGAFTDQFNSLGVHVYEVTL